MRSDEVFELLVNIEKRIDVNDLRWNSINLWPLLKQILYVDLMSNQQLAAKTISSSQDSFSTRMLARLRSRPVRGLFQFLKSLGQGQVGICNEQRAFISRAPYLQKMPSGEYFDRIVDSLVFLSKNQKQTKKYYFGYMPGNGQLSYPAACLRPAFSLKNRQLSNDQADMVRKVAELAGLDFERLTRKLNLAFDTFVDWYRAGEEFIQARKQLREIFLTSWYFPDAMGICAAARKLRVKVIDVQHGKQGRYQAMYSGWTKIPEKGYDLMPDYFWCWGKPSCDHILRFSPERIIHRPFVGGFPWLDYYKSFVSQLVAGKGPDLSIQRFPRVLVTTQPSQASNLEPIPDFILEFLKGARPKSLYFVFRCHPNDKGGVSYCEERLAAVPKSFYSIDDGKDNLYDKLLASTHHVTAYSSCCYEAEALGVPTLLFGDDAKNIYAEDIESGKFVWTSGNLGEFANWIEDFSTPTAGFNHDTDPYIVASMSHSSRVLLSGMYD